MGVIIHILSTTNEFQYPGLIRYIPIMFPFSRNVWLNTLQYPTMLLVGRPVGVVSWYYMVLHYGITMVKENTNWDITPITLPSGRFWPEPPPALSEPHVTQAPFAVRAAKAPSAQMAMFGSGAEEMEFGQTFPKMGYPWISSSPPPPPSSSSS